MSNPHHKFKLYVASTLPHSREVIDLWQQFPEIEFTARWPFQVGVIPELSPDMARSYWDLDFADIAVADALLVWGNSDDPLRGALVEAGYAMALGKQVWVSNISNRQYGTWKYAPGVTIIPPERTLGCKATRERTLSSAVNWIANQL